MKIRQHVPSFVEGHEPYEGEFHTPEELRLVPFIQPAKELAVFYRWVVHRNYSSEGPTHLLMAELDEGRIWFVLAYLEGADLEAIQDLPDWEPPNDGSSAVQT